MVLLLFYFFMFTCATHNIQSVEQLDYAVTKAPKYTYDLYFTTLFLKVPENVMYAGQVLDANSLSPDYELYDLIRSYHFAFDFGGKIVIHNKNSALRGNWEHFKESDHGSAHVSTPDSFIGSLSNAAFQAAQEDGPFSRDKLNITYGQYINFGTKLSMNLYAGVSFSRLRLDSITKLSNGDQSVSRKIDVTNKFSGIGPQIGLDASYQIHKGLNFVFHSALAFLTGTSKNHTRLSTYSALAAIKSGSTPNVQNINTSDSLLVVPDLVQKIGLSYELKLRDHASCIIEIGCVTTAHINCFHNVYIVGEAAITQDTNPEVGVYASTLQGVKTNFGSFGPYFRIDMTF